MQKDWARARLVNLAARFFACKNLLRPEQVRGVIPSSKEGYGETLRVAWPCIVESVLVSLIAAVDTMMVGGIGPHAIAAVGITNQPRFIVLAAVLSLNVGVTAVVARRKGADDRDGANRCLKQCILISTGLSLLLSAAGALLARPLLTLAGAQPDILDTAVEYFRIIMVGVFFSNIGLTINAAQRGVGNTQVSMRTNLAANAVNVVFNYLLINGIWIFPKLGVAGAGIATVMGNIVALVMAVFSVCRGEGFLSVRTHASWRFERHAMRSVMNVGGSAMVEQVFLRIGFFVYAAVVANLGTRAFATHQICMNVINLSFAVGDGFGIAASSLVGQSLGAKRPDLAILYGRIAQRIALLCSTVLFFLFIFGRYFLVGLFTSDAGIIADGAVIMIIIAFTTHGQTSQVIISGCLRGAGDTKFVALTSLISTAAIRPALTYLLCFPLGVGLYGAWFALMLDQWMRLAINFFHFQKGGWTKKEL
jgi:putative MATE family efflux protein